MSLSTLLVGLALAAAAVCGGMAFTQWGRRRPLHRYGALSVAAHLLLASGLACVRMGGPPQQGAEDAPPMRVQLVSRTVSPPEPEAEPQPDPPSPAPPELKPEETAPEPEAAEAVVAKEPPAEVESVVASPPDQAPPEPSESGPPEVAQSAGAPRPEASVPLPGAGPLEASAEPPAADTPTVAEADPWPILQPTPPAVQQEVAQASPAVTPIERDPAPPSAASASPLAPSAYSQRGQFAQRRLSLDQGGTQETLDAVASAVDWLARAQSRDGAWRAKAWGAGRETHTLGHNRRGAGTQAETGLTGLALLAMGGAGHTHLAGPYRETVVNGLQYLLDQQADDGDLAGGATLYARTYCHSMATFALAEAMAVTGDERLRPAVQAAVGYLERSQNNAGGGWRYGPGDRGDMSQMGWAIMALRSAEIAGVPIRPATWRGCERFLDSVRHGEHGGLASYQPRERVTNTMTAEAMYCRQILGVSRPRGLAAAEAVASLVANPPGRRNARGRTPINFYYWYYATLALHHHRASGPEADTAWKRWNDAMQRSVLSKQNPSGPLAGSWNPDTVWGGYGGRVYATALATMCLEVYYRYDPETIGRDPWLAAREPVLRR